MKLNQKWLAFKQIGNGRVEDEKGKGNKIK